MTAALAFIGFGTPRLLGVAKVAWKLIRGPLSILSYACFCVVPGNTSLLSLSRMFSSCSGPYSATQFRGRQLTGCLASWLDTLSNHAGLILYRLNGVNGGEASEELTHTRPHRFEVSKYARRTLLADLSLRRIPLSIYSMRGTDMKSI